MTGNPESQRHDQPLLLRAPFAVAGLALAGVSMLVPLGGVLAVVALVLAVVAKRRRRGTGTVALVVTAIAVAINAILPLVLGA